MLSDDGRGDAELELVVYDKDGKVKRIVRVKGNKFLTCGVSLLWQLLANRVANPQLGLCGGDSSASVDPSQTCLQGIHQTCVPASSFSISGNRADGRRGVRRKHGQLQLERSRGSRLGASVPQL